MQQSQQQMGEWKERGGWNYRSAEAMRGKFAVDSPLEEESRANSSLKPNSLPAAN